MVSSTRDRECMHKKRNADRPCWLELAVCPSVPSAGSVASGIVGMTEQMINTKSIKIKY